MMLRLSKDTRILALDVGDKRIGIATTNMGVRLPVPLGVILHDERVYDTLGEIIAKENVDVLVIGLPRNMSGEETQQAQLVRKFSEQIQAQFRLPVYMQDESLTSVQAERELMSRGRSFDKGEIDALAAVYILDDFLQHTEVSG